MWRDGEGKRAEAGIIALGARHKAVVRRLGSLLPPGSKFPLIPARQLQELGTIEARSKVDISASWKA